jgi:putative ABC transport system ATP-binding protein
LLLADEPTGALDSASSQDLLNLFQKVNAQGQTIVMVTHSTLAASHANRILFIRDGRLYHELHRGNRSNDQMYEAISECLSFVNRGHHD